MGHCSAGVSGVHGEGGVRGIYQRMRDRCRDDDPPRGDAPLAERTQQQPEVVQKLAEHIRLLG